MPEYTPVRPEWYAALCAMRRAGFVVIGWSPEELRGADPRRVEDRITTAGYDILDAMAEDGDA